MKKRIITLAILGTTAVAVPTITVADVVLYGHAQVEVASFDIDGAPAGGDGISVVDNARGRIGIKASEDLGGGLKGIAKFEFKADTADGVAEKDAKITDSNGDTATVKGQGALTPRESFVGLKGGWGQIEMGRLKSEYKYNGGVKYDPFVATTLEARGNGGMTKGSLGHNGFLTKSVAFRAKVGPVKLGITYAPSEDDGLLSAAVKGGGKSWEAFLAVIDNGDRAGTAPGTPSYSSVKFGGKVKIGGMHTIVGQFEQNDKDTGAAVGDEPTIVFLGYHLKMGKNTLVVQFGSTDADGGTDVDYFTLGAIHKFSKTMRIFGGYRSTSPDTTVSSDTTVISVGLRKDFKS